MEERWRIELLGQLRLCRGDAVTVPLQRQKSTALLAYLAYHTRHPHARGALTELLWPEADVEEGRRKLRSQLYVLRRLLAGPEGRAGAFLIADHTTVHLDPTAFTTDVAEFHAALRAAAGAADRTARVQYLAAAVSLYRGELLPGHYESWVLTERQALAELYLGALRQLAGAREAAGDLEGALVVARQAVSSDPLQEEAHYDVMRLCAALGQPSAALRQYHELERLLRDELEETPSAEARALAEELRRDARPLMVARRWSPQPPPPAAERQPPAVGRPAPASPELPARQRRDPSPPGAGRRRGSAGRQPGAAPQALLPVQLTCFFGREEEITRLVELLASPVTRLVTLTGPGGSGKTRLAIAVAGRLQELFGEAVAFVPLADLSEAREIPDTIADTLGLSHAPDREPLGQVVEHMRDQPWLLVLDNYEHLVEEGALLVRTLLERIPTLTCLATSRQSLGLAGEQEFALLPLPTPRRSDSLEQLREHASVQLFVDRARAAHADFQLTEANAAAVGELCDRLEGLPLALELAAARAAVLTPEQMLAQLEQRFAFLVSRQRGVPARHRTLRAALDSSYQLLDPELRQFFARLSVFRGGWRLEAARSVCDEPCAIDYLEELRGYSLIVVEERGGDPGNRWMRYRMLETLREYAWEQLAASGDLATVRKRHRDWYLQLAEQADAAFYEPEQKVWLTRLEPELDNLRAVLAWCQEAGEEPGSRPADPRRPSEARGGCDRESGQRRGVVTPADGDGGGAGTREWSEWVRPRSGQRRGVITPADEGRREQGAGDANAERSGVEAGLRLASALWWVWLCRGYLTEGLQWLEGALARGRGLAASVRAPALNRAAHLAFSRGHRQQSQAFLQAARQEYEKLLTLARTEENPSDVAHAVLALADVTYQMNDMDAAWSFAVEARQRMEAVGNRVGLARALEFMAAVAMWRGDRQAGRPLLEERLALCRKLGDSDLLIHALGAMGHLARDEGDYARAYRFYEESLALRRKSGYLLALAQSLEDLAVLAGREQQAERAIRLLGAGEAFCETLGAQPPVAVLAEYERTISEGRAALGEAAFAAAWAAGRTMSLEQAVAFALERAAHPRAEPEGDALPAEEANAPT
jgi:predicted ATPase/DNA-binding SARP family transcriptional activator